MSLRLFTPSATYWSDTGLVIMARLRILETGDLVEIADLETITIQVFDTDVASDHADYVALNTTLTIADVIFDTLQTDSRWTPDTTGFNFRYVLPATARPDGHKYRVQLLYNPPSPGQPFALAIHIPTKALLTA